MFPTPTPLYKRVVKAYNSIYLGGWGKGLHGQSLSVLEREQEASLGSLARSFLKIHKEGKGWGSSMLERLLSMHKAMGSIPIPQKGEERKAKKKEAPWQVYEQV